MVERARAGKAGRPTPSNDVLVGRRDELVWLLSVAWGDIGWHLPRAANCNQLHEAFTPLRGHSRQDLIAIFVRPTSASTTAQEIRKLRKECEKAVDRMQASHQEQQVCADSLREADAAIKANQVEDADTEFKVNPRLDQQFRDVLISQFKKREARFRSSDGVVAETCNVERNLRTELREKEAAFAQFELLHYIAKKQYARNPLSLANAMAGLPDLGWAQSYARCSKIRCAGWPNIWFSVFKTIDSMWKKHTSFPKVPIVELFRRQVDKLPRKSLVYYELEAKKILMPNLVRCRLADNFRYLRIAVEETLRTKRHPGFIPFGITALFWKNIEKPRAADESLLIAHERIG
jgi:hypothetical protein